MTINVCVSQGNILEGGADLTVLPASAKGTLSSSTQLLADVFRLKTPPFARPAVHGGVSDVFDFPDPDRSSRYCYAYSVFNNRCSPEVLASIARELGLITRSTPQVRVVETPLLGTGAGGLRNEVALKALVEGFAETADSNALLSVFVYDAERYEALQSVFQDPFHTLWDSLELKLTFSGLGLDLKKLFRLE